MKYILETFNIQAYTTLPHLEFKAIHKIITIKKQYCERFAIPCHSPVPSSSGAELLQPLQSAVSTRAQRMTAYYLHNLSSIILF